MSDSPGIYESRCSCGQWSFTGTPAEIAVAVRTLDGDSHRGHVMAITHEGGTAEPARFAASVLADIAELDQ